MEAWLSLATRLVEFDETRVVDECEAWVQLELVGARLADGVCFVTVEAAHQQIVFHEHEGFTFDRCELHIHVNERRFVFFHRDGVQTSVGLMLWQQHQQSRKALDRNLLASIPARSHHNHFCYHTRQEHPDAMTFSPAFLNRPMRTLDGADIESGRLLRLEGSFVRVGDGDMCPLPDFSPPTLEFAKTGWLGVGVRGSASLSTHTLAHLGEVASAHFGSRFLVLPVDINDLLRKCKGCNNDSLPCICPSNARKMRQFTFLSHLCLFHNELDEPYGQLASALWVTMPQERTVTMEMRGDLVRVRSGNVAGPSGGGNVGGPLDVPAPAQLLVGNGGGLDRSLAVDEGVAGAFEGKAARLALAAAAESE